MSSTLCRCGHTLAEHDTVRESSKYLFCMWSGCACFSFDPKSLVVATLESGWDGQLWPLKNLGRLLEEWPIQVRAVSQVSDGSSCVGWLAAFNGSCHEEPVRMALRGVWFWIWDNGGEIGVQRINHPDPAVFVPTEAHDMPVGPVTLACRIVQTMEGEPIDWESMSDSDLVWADDCPASPDQLRRPWARTEPQGAAEGDA